MEMHIRDFFSIHVRNVRYLFIIVHVAFKPGSILYQWDLVVCTKKKNAQLASFICADLQGGEGRVSVPDDRRADTRSRRLWANRMSDFASDILSEWFLSFNSWMVEIRF